MSIDAAPPFLHASQHAPAGIDPLTGYAASAHAAQHAPGGADEFWDASDGFSPTTWVPSFEPRMTVANIGAGLGTMQGTIFRARTSIAVTKLWVFSRTTAGSSNTVARLGLGSWDAAGMNYTPLAESVNDPGVLAAASFTVYSRSFSTARGLAASVSLVRGNWYAFSMIFVGGVAPSFYGTNSPVMQTVAANNAAQTAFQKVSQADLPTALTSVSASINIFVMAATP